ncbi:hypothetical protein WG29040_13790 [Pseudomonas sp. PAMC 29040]|uniref:DEAD/DEAH box helicase n=1 Tax=Pseudomonas sp. PAMC 29040 TaxID=2498450 RepID=UPI000FA60193|nr:DEAD/DEAH box helicase [Pseudomonas sp. PAMC 29040]RUT37569.1 hypothetical protein WG29040_13790 [Pseudomonas sp. PAMC 29040]
MTSKEHFNQGDLSTFPSPVSPAPDLIDHIDDWLEYLVKLVEITADPITRAKYERQIKYILRFRSGANCNVAHNNILAKYYTEAAGSGDDASGSKSAEKTHTTARKTKVGAELAELGLNHSMAIHAMAPVQECYLADIYAYSQIQKALAGEDIFFLQGPPGTGKTTAIVEIILQTLRSKPDARILISSETHVAVDNALDRLTTHLSVADMSMVMRYPRFMVSTLENPASIEVQALDRADAVWRDAWEKAPELTERLWQKLDRGRTNSDGSIELPRWLVRNLADRHQIIGVTCNQVDHLIDKDSDMFDLGKLDFREHLTIEVDTVDAFQGRQADVVFFSFVRTVGPATFYADDRRMNVAISRARDCVYLVGSIEYIRSKELPALTALVGRPVISMVG